MCDAACGWEGTVGTLDEHVAVCDFTVVPCSKECDKKMMRKDMKDHLEGECPNRDYECQICGEKDTYANIMEIHSDKCTMKVVPCPNSKCTQTMERAEIQIHLESDCDYTVISCKYEGIGCDVKMMRKDMGAHEQDDKAHLHQALNTVVKLQDNLLSATETIVSMKKDMESAISSMKQETAIKFEQTAQTTRVLQNKIVLLEETTTKAKRETYSFRMTKYERRKTDNDYFYSQPFYTSSSGYHMRIQVYPNGCGKGKSSHVSVYIQLMQGRYNRQLSWPFIGTVTVELLNQLVDKNHHDVTTFFNLKDNTNIGDSWGYDDFIAHHKLPYNPICNCNTQYLKDDTLYFRVSVEVEGHKPWLECTAMRN